MKYAVPAGILAAILLIVFSFQPWAFYPDLHENFTGFYSRQNTYGKPGKTFIFLAVLSTLFFLLPNLWAKRVNQFICVLIFAYALKNYYIFSACYNGVCPVIRWGLIGVIVSSTIVLAASLLSRGEIKSDS